MSSPNTRYNYHTIDNINYLDFFQQSLSVILSHFFYSIPRIDVDGVDSSEIDSVGVYTIENVVTTGEDYRYICSMLVNKHETCLNYGPNCEVKFEWSYPEHLTELIKLGKIGSNGRVRVQEIPTEIRGPDIVLYQSHLHIKDIGYAHRGQWHCNLKFMNKDTGKMDPLVKSLQIKVKGKSFLKDITFPSVHRLITIDFQDALHDQISVFDPIE